jgi:hypothetical protein
MLKSLKLMINEHQIILNLTKKIDNIFNLIGQAQLGFSNLTIGLAGYVFIIVSYCLLHPHQLKQKSKFFKKFSGF